MAPNRNKHFPVVNINSSFLFTRFVTTARRMINFDSFSKPEISGAEPNSKALGTIEEDIQQVTLIRRVI